MTATDTEAALLAAIRENPGEDTPRLVLADWLAGAGRELEAIMQRIIAQPGRDEWRLDYAAELERTAGTVQRCSGTHRHDGEKLPLISGGFAWDAHGVIHRSNPKQPHHHCDEKCRVSDGRAELAEFVRVQVELAARIEEGNHGGRNGLRNRERELWPAVRVAFEGDGVNLWCGQWPSGNTATPAVLVSRGLPAVVRCTLAEWVGGECAACDGAIPCQLCNGTQWVESPYGGVGVVRCPNYDEADEMGGSRCVGTCPDCVKGRTPGIGPRLAQRWPVAAVEVTDRRQLGANSTGGMRWTNESERSWGLPEAIFERLPTGPTCTMIRDAGESWASRISARDYESEPAARAALSDALIAWARSQPIEEGRS